MDRAARDCEVLFDTSVSGRLAGGWAAGVVHQRTRTTKAGPMVYVECYPVWDTQARKAARTEAQREAHRRAQEALNRKNARKRLERLVNANFGAGDLILTCEYGHGRQPGDDAQAARDIRNYMRRIKRIQARAGGGLRYIYVTEVTHSERYGVRYHHHVICSGEGLTREDAEACWRRKHGGICNAKTAQPTERHLSGFARYLTADKRERTMERDGKNPQARAMRRRWCASTGLKKPEDSATVADKKISIRKAGRIAEAAQDIERMRTVFERLYPGARLLEIEAKKSQWAAGVYITAILRREDEDRGRHSEGRGKSAGAGCTARLRA